MVRGHQEAAGEREAHLHELGGLVRVGCKAVDGEAQGARGGFVPTLHHSCCQRPTPDVCSQNLSCVSSARHRARRPTPSVHETCKRHGARANASEHS